MAECNMGFQPTRSIKDRKDSIILCSCMIERSKSLCAHVARGLEEKNGADVYMPSALL
jgi:hypothetical protein